jgi:hypothetical protein
MVRCEALFETQLIVLACPAAWLLANIISQLMHPTRASARVALVLTSLQVSLHGGGSTFNSKLS